MGRPLTRLSSLRPARHRRSAPRSSTATVAVRPWRSLSCATLSFQGRATRHCRTLIGLSARRHWPNNSLASEVWRWAIPMRTTCSTALSRSTGMAKRLKASNSSNWCLSITRRLPAPIRRSLPPLPGPTTRRCVKPERELAVQSSLTSRTSRGCCLIWVCSSSIHIEPTRPLGCSSGCSPSPISQLILDSLERIFGRRDPGGNRPDECETLPRKGSQLGV
jgi:hypothetical protein